MVVPSIVRSRQSGAMSPTASGGLRVPRPTGGGNVATRLDRDRDHLPSAHPGETAEDRAGHEAGAARIVEVEEPADELAGGKEAGHRRALGVDHAPLGV